MTAAAPAPLRQRLVHVARRISRSPLRPLARRVVPRPGRDALRWLRGRLLMLVYYGDRVQCPCCGWRGREFLPAWNRTNAICARCGAHERHRGLWLYLWARRPELFSREMSLLHFAPEETFRERLGALPNLRYVSADLSAPEAMEHFDITDIPHPDDAFDAIICSHVLEHVEDDARAMRELRRVLRPGHGWAIVMVPIDAGRTRTYEDPSINAPADRKRAFWQEDHVRLYGSDFPERLKDAGFEVETDLYLQGLDAATLERHAPGAGLIFACRKPRPG